MRRFGCNSIQDVQDCVFAMKAGNGAQRSDRIRRMIRSLHCIALPAFINLARLLLGGIRTITGLAGKFDTEQTEPVSVDTEFSASCRSYRSGLCDFFTAGAVFAHKSSRDLFLVCWRS